MRDAKADTPAELANSGSSAALRAEQKMDAVPFSKLIHSRPVHTQSAPSPFSKESADQNYRGFLHLTILLLVVNMLRLVVENFRKYGLLFSIPGSNVPLSDVLYVLLALTSLSLNILVSFGVEKAVVHRAKFAASRLYTFLIVANVAALIVLPSWIVSTHMYHPLLGSFALVMALVLCMKIISYHTVNNELRLLRKTQHSADPYPDCPYPANVTLLNFYYFWWAPTLCYQPTYPRIARFRAGFFLKRLVELAAALVMIHILVNQYAIPTVQNSMKPINDLDFVAMIERLLKLSISSLYIWLLSFYALFHSFLNAFAEALCFGDRMFYRSWWNANSIGEYWRLWNAPAHQWLKRHVYVPLRSRGWSPTASQAATFLISAVAHEFLVAVPTNIMQGWMLIAMLIQVPLIALTNWYMHRYPQSSVGNYFFWICLCILGQPMCVLLYYHAWINKKSTAGNFFL